MMTWGDQGSWWSMWLVMGGVVLALWALVALAVVAVVRGVGRTDPPPRRGDRGPGSPHDGAAR